MHTGSPVTEIGADFLQFGDQRIAARTILWAAGVAASPLGKQLGAGARSRRPRARAAGSAASPAHPEVFVAGDLASVEQDGKPVPGVAPAAKQMGAQRGAQHSRAHRRDARRQPFHYTDFGALATIGRHSAIAQLPNLRFSGLLAWWFWLALHIYFLIGFRSRLIVLINWAWAYFTYARGARIILGNDERERSWPRRRKQRLRRRRANARPKLAPNAVKRGLSATEVALALDHEDIAAVVELVRKAGGAPLGAYREPLGGRPLLLASLPFSAVQPTPFQRDLSPTHAKRLAGAIEATAAFLDPLIVVRGEDGRFWTPNGRHRLAAAKMLGLKQLTVLISPDESLSYRILALNTEKAHNLKDKSLEVVRMARNLAKREPTRTEASLAAEFEAAELLTLGLVYEENLRFGGGAYSPVLKKVDRLTTQAAAGRAARARGLCLAPAGDRHRGEANRRRSCRRAA